MCRKLAAETAAKVSPQQKHLPVKQLVRLHVSDLQETGNLKHFGSKRHLLIMYGGLMNCVTLDKSLNFSELWLPHQ